MKFRGVFDSVIMKKNKDLYRKQKKEEITNFIDKLETDSFNQLVFKKFVELGGLVRLTDWLNENGYRVHTKYKGHKWTTPELRKYLLDPANHDGLNADLKTMVCTMVNYVGKSSVEQRLFRAYKAIEGERVML